MGERDCLQNTIFDPAPHSRVIHTQRLRNFANSEQIRFVVYHVALFSDLIQGND
jgi:hypothetical protein